MVYGGTRFNAQRERISSKHITNAIARMLTAAQVNDIRFTSKSMRKGGLSMIVGALATWAIYTQGQLLL